MSGTSTPNYRNALRCAGLVAAVAGIPLAVFQSIGALPGLGSGGAWVAIGAVYVMAWVVANHALRHLNADLVAAHAMKTKVVGRRFGRLLDFFGSPWVQRIGFLAGAHSIGALFVGIVLSIVHGLPSMSDVATLFLVGQITIRDSKVMSTNATAWRGDHKPAP